MVGGYNGKKSDETKKVCIKDGTEVHQITKGDEFIIWCPTCNRELNKDEVTTKRRQRWTKEWKTDNYYCSECDKTMHEIDYENTMEKYDKPLCKACIKKS